MGEQKQRRCQKKQGGAEPVSRCTGEQRQRREAPQRRKQDMEQRTGEQHPPLPAVQRRGQIAVKKIHIDQVDPVQKPGVSIQPGRNFETGMTDPGCRRQQEIADQRQQLPEKLAIVCAKQQHQ